MMTSNGLTSLGLKGTLAAILSFAGENNGLISDAKNVLSFIQTNTDDAVVKLQVALCTWAPSDNLTLIKNPCRRIGESSARVGTL